jgi:hypothetical protein
MPDIPRTTPASCAAKEMCDAPVLAGGVVVWFDGVVAGGVVAGGVVTTGGVPPPLDALGVVDAPPLPEELEPVGGGFAPPVAPPVVVEEPVVGGEVVAGGLSTLNVVSSPGPNVVVGSDESPVCLSCICQRVVYVPGVEGA